MVCRISVKKRQIIVKKTQERKLTLRKNCGIIKLLKKTVKKNRMIVKKKQTSVKIR